VRLGRAALVPFVCLVALGCPRASPPPSAQARPAARVLIESPSGRESAVKVELARTALEQERGLMFRRELSPESGMLFIFSESSEHVFWMKDTLIPLDMIFIGEDGRVVGIVQGAEPLTTVPRTVGLKSRYVLEVNAGYAASHGLAAGDRVRFEGL